MLREEGKKDTFMKYAPGDAEDTYGSNERLYFQRGEDGKVQKIYINYYKVYIYALRTRMAPTNGCIFNAARTARWVV